MIIAKNRQFMIQLKSLSALPTERGWYIVLEYILSFIISVTAEVSGYFICKWLDRDKHDN